MAERLFSPILEDGYYLLISFVECAWFKFVDFLTRNLRIYQSTIVPVTTRAIHKYLERFYWNNFSILRLLLLELKEWVVEEQNFVLVKAPNTLVLYERLLLTVSMNCLSCFKLDQHEIKPNCLLPNHGVVQHFTDGYFNWAAAQQPMRTIYLFTNGLNIPYQLWEEILAQWPFKISSRILILPANGLDLN